MKLFKIIKNIFLLTLLKLKKEQKSIDYSYGKDNICVSYFKKLFHKVYITDRYILDNSFNIVDKTHACLIDLLNGVDSHGFVVEI